ncbi:MAG: hypothetical protein PHR43_07975 [Dehalococcoidales bacterium]|nr:hypothetical protein [Dehalococcoidales bacterium]
MNNNNLMDENGENRLNWSVCWLLPALALAYYIAFIPHQSYQYPLHVDDWIHFANAQAILSAGSTTYPNPLWDGVYSLSNNLEAGFQLFWGIFHQISGVSWLTIFRFFPGIILVLTVLATYIFAQRLGFGVEAAFFAALIPTTVGILGPAFLVPVALGIFFVALTLFVAFHFQTIGGYVAVFIFTCFLLAIHAPSAVCLVLILLPYIILNLKGNTRHSLLLLLVIAVPFLAPFPWIFKMLLPTAMKLLTPEPLPEYIDFPRIIRTYGYVPMALCLVGTFWLAVKGGKKYYGLVLGLLALLLMLVVYFTFHYGLDIMYTRGLMFMMLLVGVVAGAGLAAVRRLELPPGVVEAIRIPQITNHLGNFLALVLVGLTLWFGIPLRQGIEYYHLINDADYEAFVWVKENVGAEHQKAVLDPSKALPFRIITGKKVFTWVFTEPKPNDIQAAKFLTDGCVDTEFLRKNGISLVYTTRGCQNPALIEVSKNVFLLPPFLK